MSPEESAGEERRRSARAAAAKKRRSYDEAALDELLLEQIGESSLRRRRNRTLEEREKETETEALIALSLGFPIDALTEEEIVSGVLPSGADQNAYIVLRNHILALWREDVRSVLTRSRIRETVSAEYDSLMCRAFDFLLDRGYINFGVLPAIRSRFQQQPQPAIGSVIIVGAGLAGLAAAGQLLSFGFKVLVLEGRNRPGGRVYTQRMTGSGSAAIAVDLGGSVITGIHANPLGVLARQVGAPLHKIRWENCPLYDPNGVEVDPKLDAAVNFVFNQILEKASGLRKTIGEAAAGGISLGSTMETLRRLYGAARSGEERELLDWHLANLEYANAGKLSDLSLAHWDQDDPYEMGGDHCFLAGGNWRLVHAMAAGVPVLYGKTVTRIKHGDSGVEVFAGEQRFLADMALCTVPLGVLKSGSLSFDPPLPARKADAIARLGFGLLNKIAMVFPYAFWGEETDTFGCLNSESRRRGEFFLFYCYHTVAGGAAIVALVAGEAAVMFEKADPVVSLHHVLRVLRAIFSRKGVEVPEPIQTACTRWQSDPLSLGSYSHVRVGASGDDYDVLAEPISGRLFFAGEATTRQYPATMHGAFLSGLREASAILRTSKLRPPRRPPPTHCVSLLEDLFQAPDFSSGIFSFVFDDDNPDSPGLLRIAFDLGSLLHLYTFISRDQAEELRRSQGGAEQKLALLCDDFALKLMSRGSFCEAGSSLISAIGQTRKRRRRRRRSSSVS